MALGADRNGGGLLFLAVEVVEWFGADKASFRSGYNPLVRVRVVAVFVERIIRDNVIDEVGCAIVADLVSFARLKDEGVACGDFRFFIDFADDSRAADDVVEFPLSRMGVERAEGFSRRDGGDADVEGVAFEQVG